MTITPESVTKLFQSEDMGDRLRGINQLRQLDQNVAFDLIQPMIKDENARVRYAAVSQLDTLGNVDRQKTLKILKDRLFNDPEADVRAAAADSIGGLKLTEAFPDLELVYNQSSDWLIQFSIVATLGELGDNRALTLLKSALTSDNNLLQTAAISALGELGNKEAISLLLPFINNEDWQIRYRLSQALGKLGGKEATLALETLTRDTFEAVAEEAQKNLSSTPY